MSERDINVFPYDNLKDKKAILGDKGKKNLASVYPTYRDRVMQSKVGSDDPEDYKMAILDQNGKKDCHTTVQHFRKARCPLAEHPLNQNYNEDISDLASKGLMIGGTAIVAKGAADALGAQYRPILQGATLVGAGVLIYKLTDQDVKKFYRNYINRLEGDYSHLIPYNDYRQLVKKYHFKYEEDYYCLNDILAGKRDPIDMNKFMEMNRQYNLSTDPQLRGRNIY